MNPTARVATVVAVACGAALLLAACANPQTRRPPLALAERVDLQRFMGDWYVIGNIPTFIERGAHNAVESYRIDADGSIATTFTFRAGAFDGPERSYTPRGFVVDTRSNAIWGMQFVWPIKADYRIAWIDPGHQVVVIGREKRDHLWIMARQPAIDEALYQRLVAFATAQGYDPARIERVPQRWPQR